MDLPGELNLNAIDRKHRNGQSTAPFVAFPDSERLAHASPNRHSSTRIAVRTRKKILFIDAAEIIVIEARGNYVLLRHMDDNHILRQPITDVARKLQAIGFVRINRSVIVNSRFVQQLQALLSGDYLLRIDGGAEYTVTRTYKDNLRLLSPMWLGKQLAI